ncbi:hypothetical protein Taro_042250 [Colocasia esculenta]|uniref:Uncharacterized protein n=1 Tax=Colocasia esculenta TaxID=4460 RepID=A0A843WVZ2_COLES|nr:hypothetical protein [Colocasia esculenta]
MGFGFGWLVRHGNYVRMMLGALGSGLSVRLMVEVLPVLPVRPSGVEELSDVSVVYAGVVQTCTTSSRVVESFELVLPRGMPQIVVLF